MNDCKLLAFSSAVAWKLAEDREDLDLLSAFFSCVGDQLALIAAARGQKLADQRSSD